MVANITLDRLEEQIRWYSENAEWNHRRFRWLKVIELIAAALIPLFAAWGGYPIIAGLLGVVVVVLESLQCIYQFQSNFISYQSIAEALKHEKYLWYACAGHYLVAKNPEALLAERIEELVSREHAKWTVEMDQVGRVKPSTGKC